MRVPAFLRGTPRASGSPDLDGSSHGGGLRFQWRVDERLPLSDRIGSYADSGSLLCAEFIYRELREPDRVAALESPWPSRPEETEASLQLMQ